MIHAALALALLADAALADATDCQPSPAEVAEDLGAVVPSPIQEITAANFEERVLRSERPVVVEFGAVWCAPCHKQLAILKELAAERGGDVAFGKVDVDEDPELMEQLGLAGVPALLLVKDGEVVELIKGFTSKADLQVKLDQLTEE